MMRTRTSTLAPLLVLLFVSTTVRAQEPSVWLAGMEMRIGMPRQAVIDKLADAHLRLLKFSEKDDSWVIAGDSSVSGLIAFKNGRLDSATKEWASVRSNEAVARGENLANIATTLKRQPGLTIQTSEITFKRRTVSIEVIDAGGETGKQITVKETIR